MKHWTWMLMSSIALLGCADEDTSDVSGSNALGLQIADAGVISPRSDAGAATKTVVGSACVTDSDCAAPAPKCQTAVSVAFAGINIKYPGGYCTAQCKTDAVCGPGAGCPMAGVAAILPALSACLKSCEVAADCREGYSCAEVPALALPGFGAAPATADAGPKPKHCLPPLPI